jgi:enediyne biosynthesis protein E4
MKPTLFITTLLCFVFQLVFADSRVPQFTEENSGINHVYEGGWWFFVGGGVATFDCSGDAKPDVFLAGGINPSALYQNTSTIGGPLSFKALDALALDLVIGAYPIDIDNDGIIDLAVLRVGENQLYRGLGNCQFEKANDLWKFSGGDGWTTAFSATWEEGQTFPTLAFGNYVDRYDPNGPFGVCEENALYRPEGQSYQTSTALTPGYCALSMLFTDWSHSGKIDLMVSNDRQYYMTNLESPGGEQLWSMTNGGLPRLYTEADGWKKLQIWGMGIASADITGDGLPEYYLTSMADQKLRTLELANQGPEFKDLAYERGVTAHRPFVGNDIMPSTGWHAEFDDVNNDALLDLFVSKGNVERMLEFAQDDPNNMLLGQDDGSFAEVADKAGLLSFKLGRGATVTDFNLDGLLDVLVVNRKDNAQVWRNVSQDAGHWLELRLLQPGVNRDAIGSWLTVETGDKTITREITLGGGHASGELGWIHVGLGDATEATINIEWSDHQRSSYSLQGNQFFILDKEMGAQVWQPH